MKCKNCGAAMSIEDERCPFCGTPNPDAIRHRQDMKRFSHEFETTKDSVIKESLSAAQRTARFTIIGALVLAILITLFIFSKSWEISYWLETKAASDNYGKYSAMLDQYEADGDYLAFCSLYANSPGLSSSDSFRSYYYVYNAASSYRSALLELMKIMEPDPYSSPETEIGYLSDSVGRFYEVLSEEHYSFYEEDGCYSDTHMAAVEDMKVQLERCLQVYLNISDEEISQFDTMSKAQKQVIIERSLTENE